MIAFQYIVSIILMYTATSFNVHLSVELIACLHLFHHGLHAYIQFHSTLSILSAYLFMFFLQCESTYSFILSLGLTQEALQKERFIGRMVIMHGIIIIQTSLCIL